MIKILIVDDSRVMRKVISTHLTEIFPIPIQILEAEDGKIGLKIVLEESVDLILMDWNMPNMLGIDALKAIRAAGIKTPLLMVTTEGERTNVICAIQAGANNYLIKPFEKQDLHQKISQLIDFSALPEPEPELLEENTLNIATVVDFSAGMVRGE